MRGSNQRRIRSEITVKVRSDDDEDVGTAARTRPFSYDEIMLRRKNKKVSECSNDGVSEVGKLSSKETTRHESGHSAHSDSNNKTDDERASYTRRGEKASKKEIKNDKSVDKDIQELEAKSEKKMEGHIHPKTIKKMEKKVLHRSNEKTEKVGHHRSFEKIEKDRHHRSGEKFDKDVHHTSVENLDKDVHHRSGEKLNKVVHHRSVENLDKDVHHRSGEKMNKDVHHRLGEKMNRDVQHRSGKSLEKDEHNRSSHKLDRDAHHKSNEKLEKNRHPRLSSKVEKDARYHTNEKRENDMSYKASKRTEKDTGHGLKQNSEREYDKSVTVDQDYDRTTVQEQLRNKSDYDNDKRQHRDHMTSKNRKTDRDATTEREYKRKDRSGDDMKKHDAKKEKIDSSNHRHEETRLKRRRSKSPDYSKDRNKDRPKHQNDAFNRHGGSSSGLGGYSPRKRKTDAAVRTPSPRKHSPEKEQNKSGSISIPTISAPYVPQLFPQSKPTILAESAGVNLANLKALTSLPNLQFTPKVASIDSVQLTQATRPLRRLYVDNVPSSATEKEIMDCFNGFLLSAGANQIQGTKPCISCMIHKEKGQALVEFLTPEDASAALAFDSRSFCGSTLNIRRPKDFVEMANDFPERSKAGADAVSDIVKNTPHKIFVGGFSDTLSSEQLLKILHAFGPLKAFHFEVIESVRERCAFFEYVDQSVTAKACAALNGMKIGGGVLTAVQAFPDVSLKETYEDVPCYEIPQHVKTLLQKPTEVLKLKNMVDPLTVNLLSESEWEEILEDVRQECTRFGTVKSVNIVKTVDAAKESPIIQQTSKLELDTEPDEKVTESEIKPKEEEGRDEPVKSEDEEAIPRQTNGELQEKELSEIDEKMNTDHIFEPGCIFVEFKRTEASCIAAHCLHGRLFDSRTVTIEYAPHHLYMKRFSK